MFTSRRAQLPYLPSAVYAPRTTARSSVHDSVWQASETTSSTSMSCGALQRHWNTYVQSGRSSQATASRRTRALPTLRAQRALLCSRHDPGCANGRSVISSDGRKGDAVLWLVASAVSKRTRMRAHPFTKSAVRSLIGNRPMTSITRVSPSLLVKLEFVWTLVSCRASIRCARRKLCCAPVTQRLVSFEPRDEASRSEQQQDVFDILINAVFTLESLASYARHEPHIIARDAHGDAIRYTWKPSASELRLRWSWGIIVRPSPLL